SLQLVDASADASLWSRTYDKTLGSALTLQSEIAADVASRLGAELPRGRAVRPPTAIPEAYDSYLQGLLARAGAIMIFTPAEAVEAIEAPFARAVALDPDFAAAQAELAVAHLGAFAYNIDPSEQRIRRATQALEEAERISPGDPKVLAARGAYSLLISNDPAAALQAFRAARAAGLADALWLQFMADTLVTLGHLEEAIDV